jgi:FKBP-type peptidyl-prolyl cis-trans isomerase 2
MKRSLINFSAVSLLLFSCSGNREFQSLPSGVEYCFVEKSESFSEAKPGDVWNLDITYYNSDDSLLFNSRDVAQNFVMTVPEKNILEGSVEEGILLMSKGDSAVFRVDAVDFFKKSRKIEVPDYILPGEKLTFHVRLNDIIDGAEYQKGIDDWIDKMYAQELLIIKDYIERENLQASKIDSGVYKKVLKEGRGTLTAAGKTVTVNFIGHFIDGREFDNTYKRNEPFKFCLGSGKTVPGFETALATMKKGEKARFIIPSKQGYGPYGRKGVIPKFATLIFDVEMIDFE